MPYVRCWIACWLMLFIAGPKYCDSQNSYWVPSYYNRYPIESSEPLAMPSKTDYRYFKPIVSENYSPRMNYLNFPPYPLTYDYSAPSQDIQDQQLPSEQSAWEEQEIFEKMQALERILSDESNDTKLDRKDSINDKIISESLMPEETRRVVRQVRKQKPGFFWTLARLAFERLNRHILLLIVASLCTRLPFIRHYFIESNPCPNTKHVFQTFNDTQSAVKQISAIVSNSFESDTTTRRPTTSDSLMDGSKTSTMTVLKQNATTTQSSTPTTMTTSTTTEMPKLTSSQLQTLIRRNVKGLVRLFNIEWQEALKQSDINVNEFRKDLGKEVGRYLQDNPNAY